MTTGSNTKPNYYAFGMAMPGRNYTSTNYRYGFNGKENDNEVKGEGNSVDFGARIYDSRLGRWLAIDPQAERYTSYSPYHGMYCNPIAVMDNNGEENVIVIGNQGGSPKSDKKSWYKGGGYRYGKYMRHFLQAGMIEAIRLKKFNTQDGEETTILVFEGDYTEEELSFYALIAKSSGINFKRVATASEVKNYVNKSGGYINNVPSPKGRGDDLITDFTYVGHGTNNSLFIGHEADESEIFGKDFYPDAFSDNCNANLYGCGNGLDIFEYFRDYLIGGKVTGFKTTLEWGKNGLGSFEADPHKYYR